MAGHIKLDRKILLWEWYNDKNTCRLFIHLLLSANHALGYWQGHSIERGQLITGLNKLSEKTALSVRELRTSLDKLKMTGEITINSTNKFSTITICKYDSYQSSKQTNDKQIDNQTANERQTNDKQTTTNNKKNNNKEEKEDNRGTGDLASPEPPPKVEAVFKAPDGSLVKIPSFEYSSKDFNGLPDNYAMIVTNNILAVKQIFIDKERLNAAWESFKQMEIHKKVYRNKEEVYGYFSSYCKRQSWAKSKEEKPAAKKNKDVRGVEFINDFTECQMSDGSTQQLEKNQIELAKYNQINPNSITKK